MFERVLFDWGTGEDKNVLPLVLNFCARAKSKLTILNVFEPPPKSAVEYFQTHGHDLREMILQDQKEALKQAFGEVDKGAESAKREVGSTFAGVRSEVEWGTRFIEVVRRVVRTDVDLLVTSCGGEDYPDTNAMHLLRKNPSPLLICNNLKLDSPRILAAVSSADEDDEKYALDVKVLNQALGVREILGGELHVLTCWRAYLESMVSSSPRFSSVESEHHVTFARKEGESHFQHLIKAVDLPEETVKVFAHGDPGQLIPQYAREHEIDLVVMGSVGRSGVAGLLIGNTAEKIIRSLDCSIMAVKPNGFVSPIK